MTIRSNSFYQKQTIDVTVDVGSETLHGTLQFGGFGIPTFSLKNYASPAAPVFFAHVRDIAELTCTSVLDSKTYTLNKTELNEGVVFADFITTGKQQPQFDKFELHLTGISVWIEGIRGFRLKGDRLERDISTETISESFSFRSANYVLSTNQHINTLNETPVDSHFSIEHTLVIQKMQGDFSLEECKEVSHELRNLFSLLVGNSLSVSAVWVFNHDASTGSRWLYFPSALYTQEPLQNALEALCTFTDVTKGKKWAVILSQYFDNDTFRSIWNRLVPSYGKMGAWEYDILSRVIMLEMYAGVKTAGKKLKMKPKLNSDFKEELQKTIDAFSDSRKISGTDWIVFDGMARSILKTKNTSLPTLREKYEALMTQISPALKEAISFTDDDFNRIKTLRDSTAHGLSYKRKSLGENITHEMQLSDRLLVLLMCFVYLELGFTETEIASFLQHSHCRFIGNAGLNKRELSRLSGSAVFITLDPHSKGMLLRSYDMVVINHSAGTNTWCINEEITHKLRTAWFTSGIHVSLDYVKSVVPHKEGQTFKVIQQAYIKSGGVETEHFGTVIIHS